MMVKNEQLRVADQIRRVLPIVSAASVSSRPSMFLTTSTTIPQRSIDPCSIDISSIKGRFAWEKIALSDTYMPVIFRGTTKYFCVKMLQKLLHGYPDDIICRSSHYQYQKPIDLYVATPNEIELLNRINVHHSNWAYSQQPFTTNIELVRVLDFLSFYEYLRLYFKSTPISRTPSTGSLRPILPQPQQPIQRSPDFVMNASNAVREHSTIPLTRPVQIQSYTVAELPRESTLSVKRSIAPSPTVPSPLQQPKQGAQSLTPPKQSKKQPFTQVKQSLPTPSIQQLKQPLPTPPIQQLKQPLPTPPIQQLKQPLPTRPIQQLKQTLPTSPIQQLKQPLSTPPIHQLKQPLPTSSFNQLKQPLPTSSVQQPIAIPSSSIINSINTAVSNTPLVAPISTSISQSSTLTASMLPIGSSSPDTVVSLSTASSGRQLSTNSSEKSLITLSKQLSLTSSEIPPTPISTQLSLTSSEIPLTPISKQSSTPSSSSSSSSSVSKSPSHHCGWLQINKLYTPYVSSSTSNHHLYKIPVSLLTFYDLLKIPTFENNTNESKDFPFLYNQTSATPQEIELINELCLKQNIKPFSMDTKLIDLSTFYQYCSANILFVKELPLNEPKISICKDWPSIVQINGGICRLRNTTTLHEQTVPFIGNNLLKNFIISSQCLASASLTTPSSSEMEFLQLILFFSNMSINLRNAKLIDLESVQKEYNVDLILLFNDKFPLNVLNYQHQGNRSSTSQGQVIQSDSSAATNTFAESTPPPSPLSPPTNNITVNPTSQLPLTSSSSTTTNRFQKTITFHGHSMTAYICSGLGSNAQRECISVKELCNMLYPNSSITEKLETRMLRLLRTKNINRFRPQNQQSLGFTRLIDINDVEKHWNYIKEGMRSLSNNDEETIIVPEIISSLPDKDLKASTLDNIEIQDKNMEQEKLIEEIINEKRPVEREVEEEDVPVLERMNKRLKFVRDDDDDNEQSNLEQLQSDKTIDNKQNNHNDDEVIEENHHQIEVKDDDDDKKQVKIRRNSTSSVKIVPQQIDKTIKKKIIQRRNESISIKSPMSLRKQTVPIKKKIIIPKRRIPRLRTAKESIATWVEKYNIEDCCIRLDLYDPIYDTEKD